MGADASGLSRTYVSQIEAKRATETCNSVNRSIYVGLCICIRSNTFEAMYTIKRTPQFDAWLKSLRDGMTRIRLVRRLERAQRGALGDVKPVGEGVFEMREFFGPGWRMYYVQRGGVLIVMLGGGDKSTQQDDITAAQALAATLMTTDDEDQDAQDR